MAHKLIEELKKITGGNVPTEYRGLKFFVKPPDDMPDPEKVFQEKKARMVELMTAKVGERDALDEGTASLAIFISDAYDSILKRAVDEHGKPIFANTDEIKEACSNDINHVFGLARAVNSPAVLDETASKK